MWFHSFPLLYLNNNIVLGKSQVVKLHKIEHEKLCNLFTLRNSARCDQRRAGHALVGKRKTAPKWGGSLVQMDEIGFANCDRYSIRFDGAVKAVVSDEPPEPGSFPDFPVNVLISQSVILGQGFVPVVHKHAFGRHGVLSGFAIVAGMFCGSAVKVVCRADFQDISALGIDIMADI